MYFELNGAHNRRDEIAVRRTFSGFAKLLYPDGIISKDQARYILEYAIEGRRRVKEQLRRMALSEFADVGLGYIDLDSDEEIIIELPEMEEKKDGEQKAES